MNQEKNSAIEWLKHLHNTYPTVKYVLVDIEKLFSVAQQSAISSIPTIVLVIDGARENGARRSSSF